MNLLPLLVSWAVLATVVLALAIYRGVVARKEDDFIHVGAQPVTQQQAVSKKLDSIDHWGKILTVVAVVFALVILGLFLYNGWMAGTRIES